MDVPEINHMYKNVDEDKTYGSWVYVMKFYQDIIFGIFEHGVNYTHKKLLETTLKEIQAEKIPVQIMKKINTIITSFKPPKENQLKVSKLAMDHGIAFMFCDILNNNDIDSVYNELCKPLYAENINTIAQLLFKLQSSIINLEKDLYESILERIKLAGEKKLKIEEYIQNVDRMVDLADSRDRLCVEYYCDFLRQCYKIAKNIITKHQQLQKLQKPINKLSKYLGYILMIETIRKYWDTLLASRSNDDDFMKHYNPICEYLDNKLI